MIVCNNATWKSDDYKTIITYDIQCVRKVAVHIQKILKVMSTSVYTGLLLILFANIFFRSDFGKSLCTYKICWKWCPRASIQAYINLILFANTSSISAFGKSLCTYKRCWKWCPRASIQAWTRLILFANTFCRSVFGKSLCTCKSCWKWCPRASIQSWNRTYPRISAQLLSKALYFALNNTADHGLNDRITGVQIPGQTEFFSPLQSVTHALKLIETPVLWKTWILLVQV
jgi:Pyruvate/2-oxoacid:ferredoxin oxidoreductase delta subunit